METDWKGFYFIIDYFFIPSSTVEKKIAAYFEEVRVGGFFCKGCGGNMKIRKIYFGKAPPTLVLNFARFEFTPERKKLNWNMEYGSSLSIEGMIKNNNAICHISSLQNFIMWQLWQSLSLLYCYYLRVLL